MLRSFWRSLLVLSLKAASTGTINKELSRISYSSFHFTLIRCAYYRRNWSNHELSSVSKWFVVRWLPSSHSSHQTMYQMLFQNRNSYVFYSKGSRYPFCIEVLIENEFLVVYYCEKQWRNQRTVNYLETLDS
jgi:hypothetical protein